MVRRLLSAWAALILAGSALPAAAQQITVPPAIGSIPVTVAQGGTNCTVASLTCLNNITGGTTTGTGNPVAQTSPTLVAPITVTDVANSSAITVNGATQTTSQPVLNLSQTWNAGGVTFTGLKFNVTDTASSGASKLLDLQNGGGSQFSVDKSGNIVVAGQLRASNSNANLALTIANGNANLYGEAANTLALRNGTNAQTFNVYNTYTDASNYERGQVSWGSNAFTIGTFAAGTGSARVLQLATGGAPRWIIDTSGNFTASADNTYDIGASGANRPRNVYVGTDAYIYGNARVAAGNSNLGLIIANNSQIKSGSDGNFTLYNNAATAFSLLQFGGTTSSFPAIKRSSATLAFRLADDSADAAISASTATLSALASDATHTDATVCADTTTGLLYKGSGAAGICLGTSSARYKHGVTPLKPGLDAVLKLQPVRYYLNRDHGDPTKPLYGFIAEQGVKVLPELVGQDTQGRPNTFDYLGVVPVLVKAVQEQQKQIEAQKAEIAELEGMVKAFSVSRRWALPRSATLHPGATP